MSSSLQPFAYHQAGPLRALSSALVLSGIADGRAQQHCEIHGVGMHLKRSTKGPSADCRAVLNQALSARPLSMLSCSARLALTRSQWSMGKGAMLRSPASTTDLPACSSASIRCFSTCSARHQADKMPLAAQCVWMP